MSRNDVQEGTVDPRRLTEVDFDRMAESNDIHLVQAIRETVRQLETEDAPSGRETDRLRGIVAGLLDEITSDSDDAGRDGDAGGRHSRFYLNDQDRVDRARAALMAYGDRPTEEQAAITADVLADLHEHH